jgi:putative oxidoreductase
MQTRNPSPAPQTAPLHRAFAALALGRRRPADRGRLGWAVLRLVLAGLIAAHGWARWWAGGVAPFGAWLEAQGWPGGIFIAIAITVFEILGSASLALGRFVPQLCLAFAGIYAIGIALVHAKAGWFVVGLGRNGAEYSVLLIVCFLLVALQHLPTRTESS